MNIFKDFDNLVIGGDFNVPLLSLGYTRENDRTIDLNGTSHEIQIEYLQ